MPAAGGLRVAVRACGHAGPVASEALRQCPCLGRLLVQQGRGCQPSWGRAQVILPAPPAAPSCRLPRTTCCLCTTVVPAPQAALHRRLPKALCALSAYSVFTVFPQCCVKTASVSSDRTETGRRGRQMQRNHPPQTPRARRLRYLKQPWICGEVQRRTVYRQEPRGDASPENCINRISE